MRTTFFAVVVAAFPPRASAQTDGVRQEPQIRTSAQAGRDLPAEGAVLSITFSVRRTTPSEAGRANAERANAIRRALRGLGLPDDSITTRGYSSELVTNSYGRDTGFVASNSIVAHIGDLQLISRAIDTALVEGATRVGNLQFKARGTAKARLEALAEATRTARDQAETMARAAGGRIGQLIQLSTETAARPYFGLDEIVVTGTSSGEATPIQAPTSRVTVTVYGVWAFIEGRDGQR